MKIFSTMKSKVLGAALALGTTAVLASPPVASDSFYEFYTTVRQWSSGGLGVGLATTMLLMGGAIGVAKNSPMPALTGVGGAAILHWGPTVIQGIMGAVV